MLDSLKILLGLILLYYGGDFLVTGSVRLSRFFKLSTFVIGATVIAFGTSAPELAVAILAALDAAPELAMGNVIGSNIANIGLVLGLTALIAPIVISPKRLKHEYPPLFLATLIILLLAWDLNIHRSEGIIMLALLALYLWRSFNQKEDFETGQEEVGLFANKGISYQFVLVLFGLVGLISGAKFLVSGGVSIARMIGISEWFIGITIVAIGTSLPEIVASIMAARRGQGEMAIGNIFGSNIFNILMVLGITSVIHPLNIQEPIHPDLNIAVGITILLLVLLLLGKYFLKKLGGIVLLSTYCLYITLKGIGLI
ncbi:MAG: calcium/sodium antiporter [Nitrospinota bacterium]|nr:calcium/sodium antiporter [Nitrospinota bacterium]